MKYNAAKLVMCILINLLVFSGCNIEPEVSYEESPKPTVSKVEGSIIDNDEPINESIIPTVMSPNLTTSLPKNELDTIQNKAELKKIVPIKLEEFREAMTKFENKPSKYHIIMAIIKGRVFDILPIEDEQTAKWVSEKREILKENMEAFSIIHSGISFNGLHFVAIVQLKVSNHISYEEAANLISATTHDGNIITLLNFI